jgi:hypothetical protein
MKRSLSCGVIALAFLLSACAPSPVIEPLDAPYHAMRPIGALPLKPIPLAANSNGIGYSGGPVMSNGINVYFIWYGNWSNNPATNILSDWAANIGGSPYFNINTTYVDGAGNPVKNSVNYRSATTDSYSQGSSLGGNAIYNIVYRALSGGHLPLDGNAVYFVLTSADVSLDGFCSNFCGWHTYATISGTVVKYAFIGNPQRCGGSCGGLGASPNGNAAADDMASIMTHELEESATDPQLNAWGDANGENGDKCAWNFGPEYKTANGASANMRLGNRDYLIQQNWVNSGGGYCAQRYTSTRHFNLVNRHSGKLLAVASGATFDGADIIQWTADGTPSQSWQLVADGSYFLIVNTGSGKTLDVPASSTTAGTQLDSWSVNHGANQHWQFKSAGDYYTLVGAGNGMLADDEYASTSDGSAIIQWPANGGDNQQWQLKAVSP